MEYIEVPSGQNAAKKIIDSHNNGQPMPIFDALIFLAWLTTIGFSVANSLKLNQLTLENVIAYLKPEDIRQRRNIENTLAEMRGCSGCHRVAVGFFHNGITIGASKHFDKMSVVYESIAPGVGSIKDSTKDIPISKIYQEIEEQVCLGHGKFRFYKKDEITSIPCISHLDEIGVECLISRVLFNKYGAFGIIHLHWISPIEENPVEKNKGQIEKIFHNLEAKLDDIAQNRKIHKLD